MNHRPLACALFVGLISFPMLASAQDGKSVVVMKFEAVDADPAVIQTVGESVVAAIEAHPEMDVKAGGDMTMKEMAVTAGCGEPDAECLAGLKDFVDADRVVFGSVRASSNEYLFTLRLFDFEQNAFIAESVEQSVVGGVDRASEVAPAIVDGLLYGDIGTLEVAIDGADEGDVLFDRISVGTAPGTLEGLALGEHEVTVRTSDGQEQSELVVLRRDETASVAFSFSAVTPPKGGEKSKDGGPSAVPGIVSIGLGVIGLGVGAFSSLQVSEANADNDRLGSDGFVDPNTGAFVSSEAVAEAKAQNLDPKDIENRGKTFQNLQWVGYGVGAVGIGVGVFLLARSMGGSDKETSALPFDFDVTPTRDGIAASLRTTF